MTYKGEIRTVMDLTYMKQISYALHFLGAWPYAALGIKKNSLPLRSTRALFSLWLICLVTGIAYIKSNVNVLSFFELGHTYITVFMTCIGCQRVSMPWMKSYVQTTKDFVTKMHLLYFKDKSEYAMKIYLHVDKICTLFAKFLHCQMLIAVLLFNVTPLYNNYRHGMFTSNPPVNGTFEVSVYFKLPIDYTHKFTSYLAMFLANCLLSFDCSSAFCTFDLYLSIIVFHLWGHLKILKNNLENFRRPQIKGYTGNIENPTMFTEEESLQVTELIKDCIVYHKLIKESRVRGLDVVSALTMYFTLYAHCILFYSFMNLTSNAFGPNICIYYAFHQVSGCILLLECSKMDAEALGRYGVLTLVLFQQLIQLSIVFELVGSKSETLKDAVYCIPWECMNSKNRKMVMFYLYYVQEPLKLKALGIVPVGVQTMAAILKTSFSYFMLLRTVAID